MANTLDKNSVWSGFMGEMKIFQIFSHYEKKKIWEISPSKPFPVHCEILAENIENFLLQFWRQILNSRCQKWIYIENTHKNMVREKKPEKSQQANSRNFKPTGTKKSQKWGSWLKKANLVTLNRYFLFM